MNKIRLCCISKPQKGGLDDEVSRFTRLCRGLDSELEVLHLFSKKIRIAQKQQTSAQDSYSEAFAPYLGGAFCIGLAPHGMILDSFGFVDLLKNRQKVHFFIGGAYGLGEDFLSQCDAVVSLSKLTMSHQIAMLVALEQIYRALSLMHNHPYHK